MGIIFSLCANWLAVGVCLGLGIASYCDKLWTSFTLNVALFFVNACLGIMNFYRLLGAVQFLAEATK